MSDNQNDEYLSEEYHFTEEPEISLDDEAVKPTAASKEKKAPSISDFRFDKEKIKVFFNENSPARNAVVIAGILLTLFLLYKIIASIFFGQKSDTSITKMPVKQVIQPAPKAEQIAPPVIQAPMASQAKILNEVNDIKSKMVAMEQTESTMQGQISSLNNQLVSMNTNLNTLTNKLTELSQQLIQMQHATQEQAEQMMILKEQARQKAKTVKQIYPRGPRVIYYLKAVIPGRAWLIANNGNTMTVRVGTPIPGYGIVRFIDAIQGRVLTSSGQLIRFSQDDS